MRFWKNWEDMQFRPCWKMFYILQIHHSAILNLDSQRKKMVWDSKLAINQHDNNNTYRLDQDKTLKSSR